MKKFIPVFLLCGSLCAESLPPAAKILSFARSQLPQAPIRMTGELRERAENGFPFSARFVEMDLYWGENPARAVYRLTDEDSGRFQTLEICWQPGGPDFQYSENGQPAEFNPDDIINELGITWADLSFSFLWSEDAVTEKSGKKLGKDCFVLNIPRSGGRRLHLWVEKDTGRTMGAREYSPGGKMIKDIKVVSVKEFDGLWMAKDIDIIRPFDKRKTSLRIDNIEPLGAE